MQQGLKDLRALVRCARLGAGLVAAIWFAGRKFGGLTDAYDRVVAPIVERTITDVDERAKENRALRAMSAKIGLALLSYTRLAGVAEQVEVAAVAGAVTRLYDDLIDGSNGGPADDRLGELFKAGEFTPASEQEALLAGLIGAIRVRVRPPDNDTLDITLSALHEYQCLSRRQRDEAIPLAVLEKISRGKGAMANLVLCGLVKQQMDVAERELIMALGETFQALDDYMDVEQDNANGVSTLASLGVLTLTDIARSMRGLRGRLIDQYGRSATRPYCGMIYFLLLKSAFGRRLPAVGRAVGRLAGRSAALAFLTRGVDAIPASKSQEDR